MNNIVSDAGTVRFARACVAAALVATVAACGGGGAAGSATATAQGQGGGAGLAGHALLLVNADRAEAGLAPLSLDEGLVAAAADHADWMRSSGQLDHVSPEGDVPERLGLGEGWRSVGENITMCGGCSVTRSQIETFHSGWMDSRGHRANILSPHFDSFGFAFASRGSNVYAVQTFGGVRR